MPGVLLSTGRRKRAIGGFEHGVQEHVTAGGQILGLGVFDLVVADPADTGDEDHRGGRDARHVDGVMPGAADDVLVRIALCRGGAMRWSVPHA